MAERTKYYPAGCPYCRPNAVTCCDCDAHKMLSSRPDLVAQLDMEKNKAEGLDVNVKLFSLVYLWWICDKGHRYGCTVANRTNDHGCPICALYANESKLSKRTREVLEDLKIAYEPEKRFEDCRDTKPLPFDLFLPDVGAKGVLIELDGEQHFRITTKLWNKDLSPEERLKLRQKHDKMKDDYTKTRYPFLRIDHTVISTDQIKTEITKFISDVKATPSNSPPIQRFIGKNYNAVNAKVK